MQHEHSVRPGEWVLLMARYPNERARPIGVLIRDIHADRLYVHVQPDWWTGFRSEKDESAWLELSNELEENANKFGAGRLVDWLEATASNVFDIGTRHRILACDFKLALDELRARHLCTTGVHADEAPRFASPEPVFDVPTHRRWAAAACTAVLIAAFLIQQTLSKPRSAGHLSSEEAIHDPIMLPQFRGRVQPMLTAIDYHPIQPVRSANRRIHSRAKVTRRLNIASVHPTARVRSLPSITPPPEVRVDTTDPVLLPVTVPIVSPRPYRRKQKPVFRLLMAIATPFRKVAQ